MQPSRTPITLATVAALAAAALAAGGCGEAVSGDGAAARGTGGARGATDPVTTSKGPSKARFPVQEGRESAPAGSSVGRPCRLVTRTEAAGLLGRGVRMREAPQGPTCVYQPRGSTSVVTLTVQSTSLKAAVRYAHVLSSRRVAGRTGTCVRLADPMVLVPLQGGRLLTIRASCATGMRFAARAVPRVP